MSAVLCPRRAGVSLAACLVALTVSSLSSAAPHVRLRWEATDGRCLSSDDLRRAVERTLGREVFAEAPGLPEVTGRVEPTAQGFRARIELRQEGQPPARRTLSTGKVCGRLDESIAVVVSLMIDSVLAPTETVQMAVADEPPPSDLPPPSPSPPAPPSPVVPEATTPLGLGLTGGLSRNLLPGWTPEVGLQVWVRPARWLTTEVEVRQLLDQRGLRGEFGGEFSAWTATLRACAGVPASPDRLRFSGCLGLGSGRMTGTAVGLIAAPTPSETLLFAALTPARLGVRLVSRVWLSADLSARLMVGRPRFGFLDPQGTFVEVHRASLVVPMGSLSLSFESTP